MTSWKELKRFCERDGWELYKQTDHDFYRNRDIDGNVRQTKVSKGSGEIHKGHVANHFETAITGHAGILQQAYLTAIASPSHRADRFRMMPRMASIFRSISATSLNCVRQRSRFWPSRLVLK